MVDTSASPHRSHRDIAIALLEAGVRILQIRAKSVDDRELASIVEDLLPLAQARDSKLILNDRVELAASFPGVGVHLGQEDEDPIRARALLGTEANGVVGV